jgi:hypothetical protein
MISNLVTLATMIFATSTWVSAKAHDRQNARIEPSYSFALLDRKLTLLGQQQANLTEGKASSRAIAGRSMKRTTASIARTALRLQSYYERRHEQFGVRTFRLLRVRAAAVRRSVNSFEVAHSARTREDELIALNTHMLALVTQFQAASGGYSALRCGPNEWTCCSPKRKQDLRPGQSLACRWMCVSRSGACNGFRGPRVPPR